MKFLIEFITPLFSRGAYEQYPEIRPPSIRGQLHHWFRLVGGDAAAEKAVFGGVHGGASASRVVIRVAEVGGRTAQLPTLPHKVGGQASSKPAFLPGSRFELLVSRRLKALDPPHDRAFIQALEAWLLMGTLGLRATRAAGSFSWSAQDAETLRPPASFTEYEARCHQIVAAHSRNLRFALLPETFTQSESARRVVSDTLGGRDDRSGQSDLARLNDPLGRISRDRKTSPLKFRIVRFEGMFRIAAIWDRREPVTGNRDADLAGLIRLLSEKKPALGRQLADARWSA
jgi:CRISPR/Cas system CMR-associated protein Cmr1 (group 7 of RAMP superfamily)